MDFWNDPLENQRRQHARPRRCAGAGDCAKTLAEAQNAEWKEQGGDFRAAPLQQVEMRHPAQYGE